MSYMVLQSFQKLTSALVITGFAWNQRTYRKQHFAHILATLSSLLCHLGYLMPLVHFNAHEFYSSAVSEAIALNSASALERDTAVCFLVFQRSGGAEEFIVEKGRALANPSIPTLEKKHFLLIVHLFGERSTSLIRDSEMIVISRHILWAASFPPEKLSKR